MANAVLRPMIEAELEGYRGQVAAEFAQGKMQSEGLSLDKARQVAEQSLARLLPQGLSSENQHLFTLRDAETGERVGVLWIAIQERGPKKVVWIYDLAVEQAFRGRGYGESALQLVEEEARGRGLDRVELHVFGHNHGARRLYERVGYLPTSITMGKDLD
jgi:ribosomal protein S18 acetylase RimI-like enzyme